MSTDEKVIHRFLTEKRAGLGEDAKPLARYVSGVGDVIGVFDGMGGSGSVLVPEENEKDLCTMARLASRFAKRAAAGVVNQWGKDDLSKLKTELETRITESLWRLTERKGGKGPEGKQGKLRGTVIANYPTTVALAVVRPTKDEFEQRLVKALWAGDSRVYALDFSQLIPLQVLTRDHTQSGDGGDGALARYASADGLELEESDFVLPCGAAVIAMTDGCYGYMSPFRLLYTLVRHMVRSRDAEDWILRIKDDISTAAGDDTSFAISFGKGGFAALRQEAEKLLEYLEPLAHLREVSPPNPFIVPFDESAYLELRNEHKRRQELGAAHEKVSTPVMSAASETPRGKPGSGVAGPADYTATEAASPSEANPGTEKSGDLPPPSGITS